MEDTPLASAEAVFFSFCQSSFPGTRDVSTHNKVRASLRILSLTPWSANDLERNVDSAIPGKFFGGETGRKELAKSQ